MKLRVRLARLGRFVGCVRRGFHRPCPIPLREHRREPYRGSAWFEVVRCRDCERKLSETNVAPPRPPAPPPPPSVPNLDEARAVRALAPVGLSMQEAIERMAAFSLLWKDHLESGRRPSPEILQHVSTNRDADSAPTASPESGGPRGAIEESRPVSDPGGRPGSTSLETLVGDPEFADYPDSIKTGAGLDDFPFLRRAMADVAFRDLRDEEIERRAMIADVEGARPRAEGDA